MDRSVTLLSAIAFINSNIRLMFRGSYANDIYVHLGKVYSQSSKGRTSVCIELRKQFINVLFFLGEEAKRGNI